MFKRVGLFVALNLAVVVMITVFMVRLVWTHRGIGAKPSRSGLVDDYRLCGCSSRCFCPSPWPKWSVGATLEPTHWCTDRSYLPNVPVFAHRSVRVHIG